MTDQINSSVNGVPVVTQAAHRSIVQKIQSELNVANMWIDGLEADIKKMYSKEAVAIMSVAAFLAGVFVKWIL